MWQTLIHIPHQWQGIPVFGWGWALILWSVISVVLITTAASASFLPRALREWVPFIVFVALLIIFVLPMIEVPARAADGTLVPDGIAIRGYGVMMGISIAAAVALAIYRAQARDQRRHHARHGNLVGAAGYRRWTTVLPASILG